jgi:hypothetical protein
MVDPGDVGKIFSHLAVAQALSYLLAPFITLLYREAAGWNGHYGLVYCVYATLMMGVIAVSLYVYQARDSPNFSRSHKPNFSCFFPSIGL